MRNAAAGAFLRSNPMNVGGLIAWFLPARSILRGSWEWWLTELSGLTPRSWRDRLRARIEARIAGDDVELEIIRPPSSSMKGTVSGATKSTAPESLLGALRRERDRLPVWLVPPAQSVLSRIVPLPRSAVPTFAKLLSFEADRWTPYQSSDIAAAWREVGPHDGSKVDIELRFVPLASVEQWKRRLAEIELVPCLVVLGPEQELRAQLTARGWRLSRVRRVAATALAFAVAIFLIADWSVAVRERDALRQGIDAEQQEYAQQRDLEKRIADILAASREQRRGGMSKSRSTMLPFLARLFPETDWLTEIILRKDTATLRGFSANPERLLKSLGPLAGNGDAALQGEIALDAKLERQRFSVAFKIGESE
jgi:general secretion pathway protein L